MSLRISQAVSKPEALGSSWSLLRALSPLSPTNHTWAQCQSSHSHDKSALPYGFRGWWALHWHCPSPLEERRSLQTRPDWRSQHKGCGWKGVGGFHSLAFKWALWQRFSADGNSGFWSGATHAFSVCRMGISAKSQCFWWVFPCFQPSTKSGRGAWITSGLRDVLWSTFGTVN